MEYSAVTQPAPSGTWGGTLSSTLAQQRTMVSPHWMRQLPSANFTKLGVMVTGRSSSKARPSCLVINHIFFPEKFHRCRNIRDGPPRLGGGSSHAEMAGQTRPMERAIVPPPVCKKPFSIGCPQKGQLSLYYMII